MTFKVSADKICCMADEGVELGHIEFHQLTPDTVDIIHTFVEPAGRGQGIAGRLCQRLAEELRDRGMRARLSCSYAQGWFEKHEEFSDVVA